MVLYIHGYNNCIRNIVRDNIMSCNCSENGDVRVSYDLLTQFERSCQHIDIVNPDTLLTNRIFVAMEVEYDKASDNPGEYKS